MPIDIAFPNGNILKECESNIGFCVEASSKFVKAEESCEERL